MLEKDNFLKEYGNTIENIIDKKHRLYFDVSTDNILEIADFLFNTLGCRLSTGTAQEGYHHVEVQYHFSHDDSGQYFCPRVIRV